MKELDFDELDRAVASALGSNAPQVAAPSSDTPSAEAPTASGDAPAISSHAANARMTSRPESRLRKSTLPLARSAGPVVVPESDQVSEPETAAPASSTRVIPHREGRAMDFVRPGRVHKKTAPVAAPVAPPQEVADEPQEEGIASNEPVAPVNPSLEAAINELLSAEGHVTSATPTPTEPSVLEPDTPTLETPAPQVEQPESATPDLGDGSVETIAAALAATPEPESAPAATPFLPDARVEKRPLGTADLPPSETPMPFGNEPGLGEDQPALLAIEEEEPEAPLPEELQGDLLAIESGTTQTSDTPTAETETGSAAEVAAEPVVNETPQPAGPTSIARQYKDTLKQASEDDESGAIFDPQTYDQPAADPVKKSSAWKWLLAIVILIIVAVPFAWLAWMSGILPVPL